MIARMSESQKLRQKSQLKSSEISFGAFATISSRTPVLPINRMIKAEKHAVITAIAVIEYIVDIALWLLV